ncbi:MAG: hypothetical protein N4J56_005048 [Chroococcidiopsis sp. SAG 2025]|nr:hypothetical protein [Chroococcidiopsis sp. SAG 2025]
MSGAAPAFAFGIFGVGVGIYQFCQRLPLNVFLLQILLR